MAHGDSLDISAKIKNSVAQSVPSGGFGYKIAFDSEDYDTANFHDNAINNTRLTIPTTGKYQIGATIEWAINATGLRQIAVLVDGTTVIAANNDFGDATHTIIQQVFAEHSFTAGQYVEIYVFQDSGLAINVNAVPNFSPRAWIRKIDRTG